nr:MAG TPA: hypothetical protein [Caudoviricetes sp.]
MEMKNKVISFVPAQDMPVSYRERQEKHFYAGYKIVTIVNDKMETLIDARLGATDNCHYASIWLNTKYTNYDYHNQYGDARSAGKAGGWGYHRASAALDSAFRRAGMRFSVGCNGMGESAMRNCLLAAGEYLKPADAKIYLIECYG